MFDNYTFESIPLDQDLYVIDEVYLNEYEQSMLHFFNGGEWEPIGYVGHVAARSINANSVELSWYPNVFDRFHEVSVTLPRHQFVACVGSWQCDEKPNVFVKSDWLENLYLRTYSVFALIDAVNVKNALENGKITRSKLIELRDRIDNLAVENADISFISFADSLLLKSNWSVGHFKSDVKYTYKPEVIIQMSYKINNIYQEVLGLNTYAVVTQGSNEYYNDPLLHISSTQNHISLNSLGSPFSQLMEIDMAAREAIRLKVHFPCDLYMDEQYFRSLKFNFEFDKKANPSNTYQTKMMATASRYYYSSFEIILENLEFKDG